MREQTARAGSSYPLTFWLLVGAIIAIAVSGSLIPDRRIPLLSTFMPSIFIITTLCALATCVLISVIFRKSRRWELQPLIMLFLATALLDLASFLTIRLPGRPTSLIAPGNLAAPWLFACVHIILSICAVSYAAARMLKRSLSNEQTTRSLLFWFPVWTIAIVAFIGVVIASSGHAPPTGAERLTGGVRATLFVAEFAISAIALIFYLRLIDRADPNWIDLSIALTMIAGLAGLIMTVRTSARYSPAWVTAELLYLCSATFVLIAAIHDLVARLGSRLHTESQALRIRVAAAEQNAEIESSMVKSRFVAMVSHELRTPLGGIIGMTELLGREPLSERQARYIDAIRKSADGLHRIVNDLLDFSRVESGRIEFENQPFDLEQTLDDIVVLFREQARERDIELYAFIDPVAPRIVQGDQTRLKQVLYNLVNNALRFTVAGSVRLEVIASVDDANLHFYVHDTGTGIAPQALERIFEAFVQEDASTARRFGGTGLGLTIAKYLVEQMGGTIEVSSAVNIGTTFSFTLPARVDNTNQLEAAATLRDATILVLEEDPHARSLLKRYVHGWQMTAIVASTPNETLTAAAKRTTGGRRFDVLLVGAGVPEATAAALLRDIRADAATAPASTIIIRDPDVTVTGETSGYDVTIAAPLRQSTIYDAILRLRRNTISATVVPAIAGVPARAHRTERVLIAEDNDINQTLLCAQLEHLGLQADIVTDGEAAVSAARRVDYDLIFMDCQMPKIDGFEATRLIRSTEARQVPIVALTAHVLPGYRETCIAAGMSDYLAKPALIGPLTEIVDRWLPGVPTSQLRESASESTDAGDAADPLQRMRDRLREIFHGDIDRAERIIVTSLTALKAGADALEVACTKRDTADAVATAHRLKGIALEIGSTELSGHASDVERAVRTEDWNRAEEALQSFISAIASATPAGEVYR